MRFSLPVKNEVLIDVYIEFICPNNGQKKKLLVDRRDTNYGVMDEDLVFEFICSCGREHVGRFDLMEDEKWVKLQDKRKKNKRKKK